MAAATISSHNFTFSFLPSISSSKCFSLKFSTPKPLSRSYILRLSSNSPSAASLLFTRGYHFRALEENKDVSTNSNEKAEDLECNSETEVPQRQMSQEQTLDLETTLKAYKEAILGGSEQTICEIETRLCKIIEEKDALLLKYSELSSETTFSKEKHLRLQADFENFRKRTDKEKLKIWSSAFGEIMESLLPLLDNFERAKKQLKPETEKENNIATIYQGIYKHFVEVMTHFKVLPVETVGKEFDPTVHEAIAREESKEYKEGYICEEFRAGYLLGERLIRPAMVKVSTGPGPEESGSDNDYLPGGFASKISEKCPTAHPPTS